MDMSQYRDLFLSETREHINNLNTLVVTLEQEPNNRETIDALFREAHSIKGMAATMGFEQTTRLSHHLEDLLDGFRASGNIPAAIIDYLLGGIDLLDGLLDDLQGNQPERTIDTFLLQRPEENAPAEKSLLPQSEALITASNESEAGEETAAAEPGEDEKATDVALPEGSDDFQVRVDLAEDTPASAARGILILRELEKTGKLISSKPDMAELRIGAPCLQIQAWLRTSLEKGEIEAALMCISGVINVRFIEDRRKERRRPAEGGARTVRVRTDLLDQFVNLTGELITQRYMLNNATRGRDWHELTQTLSQTSKIIDDLHHHVLQSRLMPLESITGRLPRIIRDLSRTTGKQVTLQLSGTDVGIDRVILEELTDPLVHLVRNAVDHGIDKEGVVTVSARREKGLVLVEVADNGTGMDPERLRQKAISRGLITTAQAAELNDRDTLMLVCQPGFSTTEEITETSGRGVGMDVVKAAVGKLGGTLEIISALGVGTRFQMRMPLSVAIIKILLVSCAGQTLAIPLTRVLSTLDLATAEIQSSGQKRLFHFDEEEVTLYSLNAALGLPAVPAGEITWVVMTEIQGRRVGLQVDHFLGQREAFVKSLGFPLKLLIGLNGATLEGDGKVVFIIDPQALLENHQFTQTVDPGGVDALS